MRAATRQRPRPLPVALLLAAALLLTPVVAQSAAAATARPDAAAAAALAEFLAPLERHPGVRAAAAAVKAAQEQLSAARSPVQLGVSGGYSILDVDEVDVAPEVPGVQGIDSTATNLTADVTLRPFPFGDIADLVDQRRLSLEQARLDYLNTLSGLQAQALEAAQGVRLARQGVEVAQEGEALAAEALEATRIRLERGAATERELRDARAGHLEASNQVVSAREGLRVAEASLRSLVGDTAVPELADLALPTVEGVPLQVARARLQLQLAELAPRGAQRALFPTAQASYNWNLNENDSLALSVESRTLQPSVSYTHQSPGRTFPQTEIDGTFQIGVSLSISPAAIDELEAAQLQSEAAARGLEAAIDGSRLQFASLENALAAARRNLDLTRLRLQNARLDLQEAQARLDSGLAIPLDVQNAALAVTSANLELQSAQQTVLQSILDLYEFYAQPPHPISPEAIP